MPKRCEHVTSDALEILARLTGKRRSFQESIVEARWQLEIAQAVYEARRRAGASQARTRLHGDEVASLMRGDSDLAFVRLRKLVRTLELELRIEVVGDRRDPRD